MVSHKQSVILKIKLHTAVKAEQQRNQEGSAISERP